MRELYEDGGSKKSKPESGSSTDSANGGVQGLADSGNVLAADAITENPVATSNAARPSRPASTRDETRSNVRHAASSSSRIAATSSRSSPIGVNVARPSNRATAVQMYSQIQVSPSQKGNPLLQSPLMKLKPISYNKEILSDYYINPTLQILFLSLKYHQLHPEYIWKRCKRLNQGSIVSNTGDSALKVLLAVVDIDSPQEVLRKLNNICIKQQLTLIVAWSFEQAGNYIAMFKDNELLKNKVNLVIKGVKKQDIKSNLIDSLTTIKTINKTDVVNLLMEVGSFKDIATANDIKIGGLGDRKLQNLKDAFTKPFIYKEES